MQGPVAVANEFVQLDARVAGQAEDGIVDEVNGDLAVASRLNDVALANRIASLDLNDDAVGPRQRARSDDRLKFSDDLRRFAQPLNPADSATPDARRVVQTP